MKPLPWIALAFALTATAAVPEEAFDPVEVEHFLASDRDGDGYLAEAEFRTFVRKMAGIGQTTAKQIVFFNAYGFAFRQVDRNRDGRASPNEMRNADRAHRANNN